MQEGMRRADPDKYNDLEKTGNIYGGIPEHTQDSNNNGRTPVNPVAQNPMRFRVATQEADQKMGSKTFIEEA